MRRLVCGFVAGALVVCCASAALSQTLMQFERSLPPNTRTISTQGDAEINVVPDKCTVVFEVKTLEHDLGKAYELNAAKTKAVLAVAPKFHVEPADLQTSEITVQPSYPEGKFYSGPTHDATAFLVRTRIAFVLHEPKLAPELIQAVLAAGANAIEDFQLQTSELRKYRDQARLEALRAARQKAEALAAEMQCKVSRAIHVDETPVAVPLSIRYAMNMNVSQPAGGASEAAESNIALGRIPVRAHISATFELE